MSHTDSWMELSVAADHAYNISLKRHEGLDGGTFEEGWPGEYFQLLGHVHGAGGAGP